MMQVQLCHGVALGVGRCHMELGVATAWTLDFTIAAFRQGYDLPSFRLRIMEEDGKRIEKRFPVEGWCALHPRRLSRDPPPDGRARQAHEGDQQAQVIADSMCSDKGHHSGGGIR